MLNLYIQQIKNALSSYSWINSVEFIRYDMVDTDQEAILLYRIRIMLSQQGLLDAFERLTANRITKKIERTKYHFHWQDHNNQLIRRWDNAPHHPELDTFPDHVHVGTDMCQISEQHSLLDVLEEIDQFYCGQ